MEITVNDLIQRIQDLTRLTYHAEPLPHFKFSNREDIPDIPVNLEYLENLLNEVNRKQVSDMTLYDANECELLVREEMGGPLASRLRDDSIEISDSDQKVQYVLSPPTDLYIIFILDRLVETGISRRYLRMTLPTSILKRRIELQAGSFTIFDFFRLTTIRYPTVKIQSEQKSTLTRFNELITALSFQLSFNLDIAIVPQRSLVDFARGARLSSFRRTNSESIDPPRRIYISDIVYHYQMGLAAENPFVAFLSYYHVAEHFFESVFNDEIIETVRMRITQPGFSYRRKKDISQLINDVKRAYQFRAENITFNELEALKLTLERYSPLDQLKGNLHQFDENLFNYYKNDEVSFSKGPPIPWDDSDDKQVFKLLAKRIYQTRNALVHSKEGERTRYTPFTDDSALNMEIPLLRFIAESIIVGTSKIIE